MTARAGDDDSPEWGEHLRQCAGAARYRANVHKLPHNPEVAVGPKDPDVFGHPSEFITHHTTEPRRTA